MPLAEGMLEDAIKQAMKNDSFGKILKGKWIPSTLLFDAIKNMDIISPGIQFTPRTVTKVFSRMFPLLEIFDDTNKSGVYRKKFGSKFYYYICQEGQVRLDRDPKIDKAFEKACNDCAASVSFRLSRSNSDIRVVSAERSQPPRAAELNRARQLFLLLTHQSTIHSL